MEVAPQTTDDGGAQLVVVTYYIRTVAALQQLIDDFARQSGIVINGTIIVDNGGMLPIGPHGGQFDIVDGDNSFWEFSGWSHGLDQIQAKQGQCVVLLNDSFGRNWSIEWPGRRIIQAMARDAQREVVAGWLDNFSRTERRVNSRIVMLPGSLAPVLKGSINAAIAECQSRLADNVPLFDAASAARLERWMSTQLGRWDAASTITRLQRIFVEHHLFDGVPRKFLSLRPKTWLGSQLYGVARKLAGERR